jgi:hypothetical protein
MKGILATVAAAGLLAVGVWIYASAASRGATWEDDDRGCAQRGHGPGTTDTALIEPVDCGNVPDVAVSVEQIGTSYSGQRAGVCGPGVEERPSRNPEDSSPALEGLGTVSRAQSRGPKRRGAGVTRVEDDRLLSRVGDVIELRYPDVNPLVVFSRAIQVIDTGLLDGAIDDPGLPALVHEALEELTRKGSLI